MRFTPLGATAGYLERRIDMMKTYFAMLMCQNGGITPMMENDHDLATYDTAEECAEIASQNILGQNFGYEVFASGCGEITR